MLLHLFNYIVERERERAEEKKIGRERVVKSSGQGIVVAKINKNPRAQTLKRKKNFSILGVCSILMDPLDLVSSIIELRKGIHTYIYFIFFVCL